MTRPQLESEDFFPKRVLLSLLIAVDSRAQNMIVSALLELGLPAFEVLNNYWSRDGGFCTYSCRVSWGFLIFLCCYLLL